MWTWIIIGVAGALVLLLCLALAVANFSFENFQDKLEELDRVANSAHIQTLEYVQQINKTNFHGRLSLVSAEQYCDFYSAGRIGLSQRTRSSNSLASLAIVSHELGHARQDVTGDSIAKLNRLRVRGRICGVFFVPLLVAAAVLCVLWLFEVLELLFLYVGIGCLALALMIFMFSMIIKAKEIKIERQASDYALDFLKEYLMQDEVESCKTLLDSARLTYWAGFLRTLLWWTGVSKRGEMFRKK